MNENKKSGSSTALRIFCIAIVVCFTVGLIMMLCGSFGAGLIPWFAAMVIGALTLYVKRTQDKKKADAAEAEAQEREYQAQKQEKQ